ncbi:MAG: hypothetical protein ACTSYL_05395 [Candidatus Thorarchaeota archaeon]
MRIPDSIDRFTLVLKLTLYSIYNRAYLRRLLAIFIIPSFLTVVWVTSGTLRSEQAFFFEFTVKYTQNLYVTLYVVVAVVGWMYSSSSFRKQITTLTSHPISRKTIFFSRQIVLSFTVFLIELSCGVTIFAQKWLMNASSELDAQSSFLFVRYVGPIVLVSIITAIIFVSIMSIVHIATDKSSVAFAINIAFIILWDGLTGIELGTGLYSSSLVPFPTLSPAALVRNLLLQMLNPNEHNSVVESYLGFYFTWQFLIVQVVFFAIIVYITTSVAWKLFLRKSKTW